MASNGLHPGIYREDSLFPGDTCKSIEEIRAGVQDILTAIRGRDKDNHQDSRVFTQKTYFPTASEFLDHWMGGYKEDLEEGRQLGFELNYVNLDPGSEFYSIEREGSPLPHEGIFLNRPNPLLLCADTNGISDLRHMNLGVNDVRTNTYGVYRGIDPETGEYIPNGDLTNPSIHKPLDTSIGFYPTTGREPFPFSTGSSDKGAGKKWHMVGTPPEEAYDKIKELGFVWPE